MLDFEIETVSLTESSSSENTLTVCSVGDPRCEQHKLHFGSTVLVVELEITEIRMNKL